MSTRKRDHQEDEDLSPFYQLQKSQVLHEAKAFNDTPLDSRKCCSVLTELLCLLSQGEVLGKEEATTLFFGVTKLFQSQDPQLRRLVYLVIKELNKNQDDAFIVISSLEKDINGNVELFRANALRVHSQVIDSSMLEQRARLFRQAIVSKSDHISSSALTAGIRMFNSNKEVVKRWQNETREATKSSSKMVSFHALHLLYKLHSNDRRAVMRLVTSLIHRPPESPLARCLLIRYAYSCIARCGQQQLSERDGNAYAILEFIKSQIKQYKAPMVMFEAAKCLCHLPYSTEQDLTIAMNVLQEFLNSPRPIQRFAAVRALAGIVSKFNNILSPSCTVDLEHLITDGNRNIATLAITTLLQTTAEYSIERLLSSISDFMNDIADELKIVLVGAIESVCRKFPKKYQCLLNFLSMALREEGGYKFKDKIVDCMLILMSTKQQRAKQFGLDSLCEFIEDCEYPLLSVRILYLIGQLGPSTKQPSRFIRFIFNRVLLELPCVRAAAVSCLTKTCAAHPMLCNDILQLLKRSLNDEDDEVRDRATLYVALLENFKKIEVVMDDTKNEEEEEEDVEREYVETNKVVKYEISDDLIGIINIEPLPFDMDTLESSLLIYLNDNEEKDKEDAFMNAFGQDDIDNYVKEKRDSGDSSIRAAAIKKSSATRPNVVGPYVPNVSGGGDNDDGMLRDEAEEEWNEFLKSKQSDLPQLGDQICVSSPEQLTEPEAEYQAEVIKRIYAKYVVLQFNVQQSIPSQLICDVYVDLDYDETPVTNVTCPVIKSGNGDSGICLAIIEREEGEDEDDEEDEYILGKFECVLKFIVKDDGDNAQYEEGYEDDYVLNEITMNHFDYLYPAKRDDLESVKVFKEKWKEIGKENEEFKKGNLNFDSLQSAISAMMKSVGLCAVEESHRLNDEQAQSHALNLIAYTDKRELICMRAAFVKNDDNVSYKAAVRCKNQMLRSECISSF